MSTAGLDFDLGQDLESLRRQYPKHAAARLAVARLSQPEDRAPSPAVTLEMPAP